jgi:hypothetical protein
MAFISPCDSIGPTAKSPEDIALITDILIPERDFTKNLTKSWERLKIGFLEQKTWASAPSMTKP